jgi:uncharacterized protein (DUF58 family)
MPLLTPEELRELRRLHIQAGRKVNSLFAGDYRSALRGQGMEFEEVRAYHPGDDVRHIDWNVTARTGEPFIKIFREERQLTVILLVDVSGSARVGTGGRDGRTDRRLQIARIAGSLAFASLRNRDRVGLVTFSDQVESYLAPRRSRGHSWAVIQAVYAAESQHRGTDIRAALDFVAKTQRRRATVLVISDFLDPARWERTLGTLARRHRIHSILVHDPIDHGLPNLGLVEIQDVETGRPRLVDAAAWGARWTLEQRVARLRGCGTRTLPISTGEDPYGALHRHFHSVGGRR